MTQIERLAKIIELLEAGHTVIFSTYLRGVKVTARNFKKWNAQGLEMFKATETSLRIRSGKGWEDITYTKVTVQ